tara:strand:+ start:649 stop:1401 length:753 start_codon:yes stop_codon:yes gene_type:complete
MEEGSKLFIISPVHNAEEWIGKCIESTKKQTYKNFMHVIIDDASTDDTFKNAIEAVGNDDRYILGHVPNKCGTLHSHIQGVENSLSKPNDIIVHLDGDDWFTHENVLQTIADRYKETKCLATYGNYKCSDGTTPSVCRPISETGDNFREWIVKGWCFSQVRTFYRWMWDKIKMGDFLDSNGKLFTTCADVAIFTPMLEMAGKDRIEYIEDELMIYNLQTPNNDFKIHLADQVRCGREIAMRKPYERAEQK